MNVRSLQQVLAPDIQDFIQAHAEDDIAALALKGAPDPDWDWPCVLGQIAARQKAVIKMPSWAGHKILYPAPGLIEQASSEGAARYKASLAVPANTDLFADLTAGTGVDTLAFLKNFGRGIAVERDEITAACLKHNLHALSDKPCTVLNQSAEDAGPGLPACDLIYIDPQRRDNGKKGLFRLDACSPDILRLLPDLRKHAHMIMIKTSPMLDIDSAVTLLPNVGAIHIVEWRNECREVLYILNQEPGDEPLISAVTIDDQGVPLRKISFTRTTDRSLPLETADPDQFLFEPSPAFQKAGGFRTLAAKYGLKKLHPDTHLFTGPNPCTDFPGRSFTIEGIYNGSGKDLPLKQASVTVRNFPAAADDLRKKLKLRDGGPDTLFACTLQDGRKALIHARKLAAAPRIPLASL